MNNVLDRERVRSESESLGGSVNDHLVLARQLGILDEEVGALQDAQLANWETAAGKKLRREIDDYLAAVESWDETRQEQALRVRLYFETLMLWHVAKDSTALAALLRKLKELQRQIRTLANQKVLSASDRSHCWKLDAAFHKAIFSESGRNNLADAVDRIQQQLERFARPSLSQDVLATWEEHEAIIEALRSLESGRRERILSAVRVHFIRAFERVFAKEGKMDSPIEECIQSVTQDLRDQVRSSRQDFPLYLEEAIREAIIWSIESSGQLIPAVSCDFIRESLVTQFLFPGRFVVYSDQKMDKARLVRLQRTIHFVEDSAEAAFHRADQLKESNPTVQVQVKYQRPIDEALASHL